MNVKNTFKKLIISTLAIISTSTAFSGTAPDICPGKKVADKIITPIFANHIQSFLHYQPFESQSSNVDENLTAKLYLVKQPAAGYEKSFLRLEIRNNSNNKLIGNSGLIHLKRDGENTVYPTKLNEMIFYSAYNQIIVTFKDSAGYDASWTFNADTAEFRSRQDYNLTTRKNDSWFKKL